MPTLNIKTPESEAFDRGYGDGRASCAIDLGYCLGLGNGATIDQVSDHLQKMLADASSAQKIIESLEAKLIVSQRREREAAEAKGRADAATNAILSSLASIHTLLDKLGMPAMYPEFPGPLDNFIARIGVMATRLAVLEAQAREAEKNHGPCHIKD
jgi:hypothetical protein